jgi:hypothetical protein
MVSSVADDAVSKRLKEDPLCKQVLCHIISTFGYQKCSFNKPGYRRLITGEPRNMSKEYTDSRELISEKFDEFLSFFNNYGLVRVGHGEIEVNREKVAKYIPRGLPK